MVEKEGYEVTGIVGYGEEVAEAIEKHNPHIVLMDIFLKGKMNGVEVTQIINERYRLPVIYITGNTDEATQQSALKTKPVGYLQKPVHRSELMLLIKDALSDVQDD
ncbi:response regulator, partial [Nitrospirota bacterium]